MARPAYPHSASYLIIMYPVAHDSKNITPIVRQLGMKKPVRPVRQSAKMAASVPGMAYSSIALGGTDRGIGNIT